MSITARFRKYALFVRPFEVNTRYGDLSTTDLSRACLQGRCTVETRTLPLNDVETEAASKGRRFLGLSKADAGWLLLLYVLFFLGFRLGIGRHNAHAMATGKAALLALPSAAVMAMLLRNRSRHNPVSEESHFTTLSLDKTDGAADEVRVSDDDERSQ